jgi:hypothetical protein
MEVPQMRFIAMTLNDFYYISLALVLLCMLVFFACFVRFIYKELGGIKVGKDSLLFFDFMLFGSGWKSDTPVVAMAGALFFGNLFDYIRNYNIAVVYINIIGFLATFLLFVHCRFLSGIIYNGNGIKFTRELFLNFKPSPKYIFLWLSRILYITLVIYVVRN